MPLINYVPIYINLNRDACLSYLVGLSYSWSLWAIYIYGQT